MKKKAFFIIALTLIVVASFSLAACNRPNSVEKFTVNYIAGIGGYIDGQTSQRVACGGTTSSVTAIPNAGYVFGGWSDNKTTPTRNDKNVSANINITANFVTRKTFTYVYNEATGNNKTATVELRVEKLTEILLVVPVREGFVFCGWYLDWLFTEQVSDELGNIVIDDGVFASNSNKLFAKWIAIDAATYEILMVYVTDISAELERYDGTSVIVEYKMTETEKQVCELVSTMFEQYLNALLNGLVVFEIDNHFTTEVLGREYFNHGSDAWGNDAYMLNGYDIPEIGGMLSRYRSVITTFNMNDYDFLLLGGGGYGNNKYAGVHMEMLFSITQQGFDLEYLFDFSNQGVSDWWEYFMQLYLHEFTHTVEMHKKNMEIFGNNSDYYHDTLIHYGNKYGNVSNGLGANQSGISEIEVIRLFLLNRAIVDNKTIGIPKDFWFGETDVTVNYVPNVIEGSSGGQIRIVGDTSERPSWEDYVTMEVPFGSDVEVVAVPHDGYKFIKWSDGITTDTRHDINIISYLTVKAIFERV